MLNYDSDFFYFAIFCLNIDFMSVHLWTPSAVCRRTHCLNLIRSDHEVQITITDKWKGATLGVMFNLIIVHLKLLLVTKRNKMAEAMMNNGREETKTGNSQHTGSERTEKDA